MFIDTNKTKVLFNYVGDGPDLSEIQLVDVEKIWERDTKRNPLLFNGKHFSVLNYEFIDNVVMIDIGVTEYKYRIWSKTISSVPAGVRPITLVVFIYDPDNDTFYMARRSRKVEAYQNEINGVGGNVDFDEGAITDIRGHIHKIAIKELDEEVILDRNVGLNDIRELGFVFIPRINYLCFQFICKARIVDINDKNELVEIIPVKRLEYKKFVKNTDDARMPWLENDLHAVVDRLVNE